MRERLADWWDLLTARLSIRFRTVRVFSVYRGLMERGREGRTTEHDGSPLKRRTALTMAWRS